MKSYNDLKTGIPIEQAGLRPPTEEENKQWKRENGNKHREPKERKPHQPVPMT